MFSAPERPAASRESWQAHAASISGERIGLHRRAHAHQVPIAVRAVHAAHRRPHLVRPRPHRGEGGALARIDRKSTRLNSSHANISYAVFCLKKKKKQKTP